MPVLSCAGYIVSTETELYYLQSRYYDPEMGRFISADTLVATGQGLLGNNVFAYCLNNPVGAIDPNGQITISSLILIGSAVIGVASAAYTAYTTYQAGWDTADIIWYSIGAGLSGFLTAYSLGSSAYQLYLQYCMINGVTPVTEIGGTSNVQAQLQTCATTANGQVSGTGPVAGTKKHTAFASEVNALGNSKLRTEVSYLNGYEVPYGTRGSVRFDVMYYDNRGNPVCAWDFKTGSATLSASRVAQMQAKSGLKIPIMVVR